MDSGNLDILKQKAAYLEMEYYLFFNLLNFFQGYSKTDKTEQNPSKNGNR